MSAKLDNLLVLEEAVVGCKVVVVDVVEGFVVVAGNADGNSIEGHNPLHGSIKLIQH